MSTGGSIRALVDAEIEAKKLIKAARDRKSEISAAAKAAARREIILYNDSQDAEFAEQKEAMEQGSHQADAAGAEESARLVDTIQRTKDGNKTTVVDALLRKVLTVEIPMGAGRYDTIYDGNRLG
eukprot:TRINITY_DN2436_c1_g2_i1.p2 TRINITY_DN2436_c1_g2~~TRINITY_DN2436_c1_g2_i1.p2  ORF type:complete len:125 (+),score=61.24 TRINITY_DN2436_c1_g2_i1:96-470(+)